MSFAILEHIASKPLQPIIQSINHRLTSLKTAVFDPEKLFEDTCRQILPLFGCPIEERINSHQTASCSCGLFLIPAKLVSHLITNAIISSYEVIQPTAAPTRKRKHKIYSYNPSSSSTSSMIPTPHPSRKRKNLLSNDNHLRGSKSN